MAGISYGLAITDGVQINSGVTMSAVAIPTANVDMLVVAAGGGGGAHSGGGGAAGSAGGGAGGLIYEPNISFEAGATYTVTVSGAANNYANGGNTTVTGNLISLVAIGGGRGGQAGSGAALVATGQPGGSGGGSTFYGSYPAGGAGLQPASASGGFGNQGGQTISGSPRSAGGGGAGAVGVGSGTDILITINGGAGLQYDISGTSTYYSGGGSGENSLSNESFGAGANNYGGGGEVLVSNPTSGPGVVYIRHPVEYTEATVTGTVTVYSSGAYKIYRFNGAGTIIF